MISGSSSINGAYFGDYFSSKTFIYYPITIVSVKSALLPENYKFLEAEELFYNFISKSIRGELLFKEILDFFFYC